MDNLTRTEAPQPAPTNQEASTLPPKVAQCLREHLWLSHGHKGVYGDDGEMQCSECWPLWDYKRAPLADVVMQAIRSRRAVNMAALVKAQSVPAGATTPEGSQGESAPNSSSSSLPARSGARETEPDPPHVREDYRAVWLSGWRAGRESTPDPVPLSLDLDKAQAIAEADGIYAPPNSTATYRQPDPLPLAAEPRTTEEDSTRQRMALEAPSMGISTSTAETSPSAVTRLWSCGASATGSDNMPITCPEHGKDCDLVCEHGTAMDVHCCGCQRRGFFPPDECDCYPQEQD